MGYRHGRYQSFNVPIIPWTYLGVTDLEGESGRSAVISPVCVITIGTPNTTKVTKDQLDFIHWIITLQKLNIEFPYTDYHLHVVIECRVFFISTVKLALAGHSIVLTMDCEFVISLLSCLYIAIPTPSFFSFLALPSLHPSIYISENAISYSCICMEFEDHATISWVALAQLHTSYPTL